VADPDSLIGQTLAFRVIETGDKTVLDRRVMQEEEVAEQAVEIWASIQPGDTHAGVVRNVRDFGAFVDIGGVDGLVPRSEIGWSRGADPREVLQVGQRVEVTVLEVDGARKRLTLSCKTAENDPWQAVGLSIAEGGTYEGSVARVEDFGAFVELSAGVTGLLHVSRASGALPAPGETVSVRVTGIDHERRRLELSSTDVTSTGPAAEPPPAARVSGSVVQVLRNGVAITLEDGRSAWLPAAQVELPAGTMLAQRFRRGRRVEARVLKMDRERVVLTMRDDADGGTQSWRQHLSQRSGSRGQGSGAGFGTLGDLLKGLKKD
jgi:small subunit ribosomal protein S1